MLLALFNQMMTIHPRLKRHGAFWSFLVKDEKILALSLSKLPIYASLITDDWQDRGIANIFIVKTMSDGTFAIGLYLIDIWCLGVKDAGLKLNADQAQLDSFLQNSSFMMMSIPYENARSIIFGGLKYAYTLDIEPHTDWRRAKALIEPDRSFDDTYIFGHNGIPFYYAGPYDADERDIVSIKKKVKKAGGKWTIPTAKW